MIPIVELKGIEKRFKEPLFSPVSFELAAGEGLALVGRNGSGKTTLLDIIAGLRRPDAGSVRMPGTPGYVMQTDGLSGLLSCRDNLMFEAALCRLSASEARARVNELAEVCGISGYMNKRLSRCSAGMRQRVAIAASLLKRPEVLLMDEAFAALDTQSVAAFKEVVRDVMYAGTALVFASHDRGDFDGLCRRMLTLPEAVIE